MDLSQLPKMSDTPKPPLEKETRSDARRQTPDYSTQIDGTFGFGIASVWISLIVGLILLMLGGNFGRWAIAKLSGQTFQTGVEWKVGEKAGQMVEYFDLQGGTAISETGLFLMGVALVLDAVLMFAFWKRGAPSKALLYAAIFLTGLALTVNVLVAGKLVGFGMTPLITMCAILVGGIMMFDHFTLLGMLRRSRD